MPPARYLWTPPPADDNLNSCFARARFPGEHYRTSSQITLMLRICRLLVASVTIFAAADLVAQTTPTEIRTGGSLNPGDQIRIAVWRQPEFSGDFAVTGDGTVAHPLYREVQVTGIPISTVEERLRTFLTRYIATPQFVIQPLVKIILGGEVRSPNVYAVPPETSVAQAIVLAGGPTESGRLDRIRVIRDGGEISVDLTDPRSTASTLQIRSGDQILVARRRNVFRDYVAPGFSIVGAAVGIANIFIR